MGVKAGVYYILYMREQEFREQRASALGDGSARKESDVESPPRELSWPMNILYPPGMSEDTQKMKKMRQRGMSSCPCGPSD